MSQEDAAAASGIDYKRIQRIEAGSVNITVKTLVRLTSALGTTVWRLTQTR
jgi:transcriptional regulator with XRE-family HTH domain